uniref:Uncharacterized protein n=1 Tax=Arundo donax TaxID=35708 RepID=A0A0A8XNN0_ARUDO
MTENPDEKKNYIKNTTRPSSTSSPEVDFDYHHRWNGDPQKLAIRRHHQTAKEFLKQPRYLPDPWRKRRNLSPIIYNATPGILLGLSPFTLWAPVSKMGSRSPNLAIGHICDA